ncbi:hypothetical protein BF49_5626 [Bradyrhizobium sp.]|uniref:hypothetical protein n=1 Tax=Bradyrhizobium sp. TaxID=376 RepID=UPI0007C199EF|nr:hypothetical protein [Bradyrhizobium sp.]CUT14546.1 hypothetical protein BF49_5626 [Bradyrhizobium sp.]
MPDKKLSARAERIIHASAALYGERGHGRMAEAIGISKQMMSFIVHGDRPVTDDVERKVAEALVREADRLRKTAERLEDIAIKMREKLVN